MTPVETAWTAGLFEGEGCISANQQGTRRGGTLVMLTTDLDVLQRFVAAVGCGTIRGPLAVAKPHHKPPYEWRAGRWSDVERLLLAWMPLLGERRTAKAEDLLSRPRLYVGRQGFPQCIRGHELHGPDANVREWKDRAGRTVRTCRPCNAEKLRELRARRRAAA